MSNFGILLVALDLIVCGIAASSSNEFLSDDWAQPSSGGEKRSDESKRDFHDEIYEGLSNHDAANIAFNARRAEEHREYDSMQNLKNFLKEVRAVERSDRYLHSELDSNSLQSPEIKRNVPGCPQPGSIICNTDNFLCWGLNHPQCIVRYSAPASTLNNNRCRVSVRCNYTSDFENNNGVCFAGTKAFPPPVQPGATTADVDYRYNFKIIGTDNGNILHSYNDQRNRLDALASLRTSIDSNINHGIAAIVIISDYVCAHMTPCNLHN